MAMFPVAAPVPVVVGRVEAANLPSRRRRRHSRSRLRLRLFPPNHGRTAVGMLSVAEMMMMVIMFVMLFNDVPSSSRRHNNRQPYVFVVMAQENNNLPQTQPSHYYMPQKSGSNPSAVRRRRRPRCSSPCAKKGGLGGHMMRKIHAATDNCRQLCSLLLLSSRVLFLLGWECGTCADWEASFPGFDMQLNVVASNPDLQPAFYNAASKWSSVISGDLKSVNAWRFKHFDYYMISSFACPRTDIPNVIDDLYVCGAINHIDGPGRILGQSGLQWVRKKNGLPIIGMMQFDQDDVGALVERGVFNGIILHEMGHMLGFTSYQLKAKELLSSVAPPCYYNANAKASREWQSATGCPSTVPIPMEQGGTGGTACSHWDETCLVGELMTGYVRNGGLELSRMTVAALEDLGYAVNYSAADAFTAWNTSCVENLCSGTTTGGRRERLLRRQRRHLMPEQGQRSSFNVLPNESITTIRNTENQPQPRDDYNSNNAIKEAWNYGKQYLQSQKLNMDDKARQRQVESDVAYMADQVVFLVYLGDDDQVHSLVVTSDE